MRLSKDLIFFGTTGLLAAICIVVLFTAVVSEPSAYQKKTESIKSKTINLGTQFPVAEDDPIIGTWSNLYYGTITFDIDLCTNDEYFPRETTYSKTWDFVDLPESGQFVGYMYTLHKPIYNDQCDINQFYFVDGKLYQVRYYITGRENAFIKYSQWTRVS